ncbi:MAG: (2Fe-2S) ferredoxin domain-containing protein [Armatimonadota bacterium]
MKPTKKLEELKNQLQTGDGSEDRLTVRIGMATCGISAGADVVYEEFVEKLKEKGLDNVDVIQTGCVGRCDLEPMAEVGRKSETPMMYVRLNKEKVDRIVQEHLVEGKPVREFME